MKTTPYQIQNNHHGINKMFSCVVVSLEKSYDAFKRSLDKESPSYCDFSYSDLDEISAPIVMYIVKYGHTPPRSFYMGDHMDNVEDTLPEKVLREICSLGGFSAGDACYLVNLIANQINFLVDDLQHRHIDNGSSCCEGWAELVSPTHWGIKILS